MTHWTDKYVGRQYKIDEYDCVHLLAEVQTNEFGNPMDLPTDRRANVFALSEQIRANLNRYTYPIAKKEAKDGDMVLLKCKNRLNHTGVYAEIGGVGYVLHNLRNIRSVALHKVRELEKYEMAVEGFYRFKGMSDTSAGNVQ